MFPGDHVFPTNKKIKFLIGYTFNIRVAVRVDSLTGTHTTLNLKLALNLTIVTWLRAVTTD